MPAITIDILPVENLTDIFLLVHCHPNTVPPTKPNQGPLLFCSVSSRWREIALQTPALWSSVIYEFNRTHNDGTLDILEEWYSRSGSGYPLTLKAHVLDKTVESGVPPFAKSILNRIIIPYTHRFRVLHLSLDRASLERLLCSNAKFDALKQVTINNLTPNPLRTTKSLTSKKFNVFDHCQFLDTVELINLRDSTLNGLSFMWPNLTTLVYDVWSLDIPNILNITSQCVNIQKFTLTVRFPPSGPGDPVQMMPRFDPLGITLSNLECFNLSMKTDSGSFELKSILNSLTMPNLQMLMLSATNHKWFHEPMLNLISRSCCSLRHISIFGFYLRGPHIEDLIRTQPLFVASQPPSLRERSIGTRLNDSSAIILGFAFSVDPDGMDLILQILERQAMSANLRNPFMANGMNVQIEYHGEPLKPDREARLAWLERLRFKVKIYCPRRCLGNCEPTDTVLTKVICVIP